MVRAVQELKMTFKSCSITVAALLAACGGSHGAQPPADSTATFVAFPATFQGFRSWTHFHSEGPPAEGMFSPDVLGPREQYINHVPPPGSKDFPVGTVIVEVRDSGSMKTFAGVKRGGGFNVDGATDWEWFELAEDPQSSAVSIVWRGTNAPAKTYGGSATSCNDCHKQVCAQNDFVCSPYLQLAGF
jgi:hypothetical protein